MDRQQLNDAASQLRNNKIEFADKIPEGAGGRYHRITGLVQRVDSVHHGSGWSCTTGDIGTKLPYKGIVDNICAARVARFHINNDVLTIRPGGRGLIFFQKIAFGFKMPHLTKGKMDPKPSC